MQSEDVTCPVCVARVVYEDGAYASLVVDGAVGEAQHDTFHFPRPWRDYVQWSLLRRDHFAHLLRPGNLINITFDAARVLQEISSTNETDYTSFLIISDDVDAYFTPSEKAPREVATTATTTTVPPRDASEKAPREVATMPPSHAKPMRVKIILESGDGDTLYAKRLPGDKAHHLTAEYLRRLARLFPDDAVYQAMLSALTQ